MKQVQIKTTRCGNLIIEQEKIIAFPSGIPGFEELKRFILLPEENIEAFHWLQSVDEPAIAFLVVNPFIFFPDYCFNLSEDEIKSLNLQSPKEVMVVNIISIPKDRVSETTANLVGPVVINTKLRLAKQVILSGTSYSTKHMLFDGAAKKETGSAQGKGETKC
jgi:flagellar assembly factor FliW